jgi:hypothetical protein
MKAEWWACREAGQAAAALCGVGLIGECGAALRLAAGATNRASPVIASANARPSRPIQSSQPIHHRTYSRRCGAVLGSDFLSP